MGNGDKQTFVDLLTKDENVLNKPHGQYRRQELEHITYDILCCWLRGLDDDQTDEELFEELEQKIEPLKNYFIKHYPDLWNASRTRFRRVSTD